MTCQVCPAIQQLYFEQAKGFVEVVRRMADPDGPEDLVRKNALAMEVNRLSEQVTDLTRKLAETESSLRREKVRAGMLEEALKRMERGPRR